jgi:hypothetical protein
MKHQIQPNRWSCSVTSAAMVMDIPVVELIDKIGHDGGDIIFPDNEPPNCYRGFDISEIIDAAMKFGYAMTPIHAIPVATPNGLDTYDVFPEDKIKPRMDYYLDRFNGIAYGIRINSKHYHVIAWDKEERQWHDPSGGIWQRDKPTIDLSTLWVFQKSEANALFQSLISEPKTQLN